MFNKKFLTFKIKFQKKFQKFLKCLLRGFLEIGQKSRVPIFRFPLRRHFKKIWIFFWNFILKVRNFLLNKIFTKMPPYRLNWYHFWPFLGDFPNLNGRWRPSNMIFFQKNFACHFFSSKWWGKLVGSWENQKKWKITDP